MTASDGGGSQLTLGGGHVSERGGTFVGPTQERLLALAGAVEVGTFDTYDQGQDVYVNGSNRMTTATAAQWGRRRRIPRLREKPSR